MINSPEWGGQKPSLEDIKFFELYGDPNNTPLSREHFQYLEKTRNFLAAYTTNTILNLYEEFTKSGLVPKEAAFKACEVAANEVYQLRRIKQKKPIIKPGYPDWFFNLSSLQDDAASLSGKAHNFSIVAPNMTTEELVDQIEWLQDSVDSLHYNLTRHVEVLKKKMEVEEKTCNLRCRYKPRSYEW